MRVVRCRRLPSKGDTVFVISRDYNGCGEVLHLEGTMVKGPERYDGIPYWRIWVRGIRGTRVEMEGRRTLGVWWRPDSCFTLRYIAD